MMYTPARLRSRGYSLNGNQYRPEYPNGREDVRAMLRTLKEHSITPGLHVLQTHIGVNSRYVTPVADHRLHLKRHFTLAQPLDDKDTVITVEQNPIGSVMAQGARVLQFGGELIAYEAYTTQPPYQFTGCRRGAYNTHVVAHPMAGQIGGILDISEYGGTSVVPGPAVPAWLMKSLTKSPMHITRGLSSCILTVRRAPTRRLKSMCHTLNTASTASSISRPSLPRARPRRISAGIIKAAAMHLTYSRRRYSKKKSGNSPASRRPACFQILRG